MPFSQEELSDLENTLSTSISPLKKWLRSYELLLKWKYFSFNMEEILMLALDATNIRDVQTCLRYVSRRASITALNYTLAKENYEMSDYLLANMHLNSYVKKDILNKALFNAVGRGDLPCVHYLCKKGANVNALSRISLEFEGVCEYTPLMLAVYGDTSELRKTFGPWGAEVRSNKYERAKQKEYEKFAPIVELLCIHGAEIDLEGVTQCNSLSFNSPILGNATDVAQYYEKPQMLRLLKAFTHSPELLVTEVLSKDPRKEKNILPYLGVAGHQNKLQLTLADNENGESAFSRAVGQNDLKQVTVYLEDPRFEIYLNIPNLVTGKSPLKIAAENINAPMVELLLKHGANPNLENIRSGETILMSLVQKNKKDHFYIILSLLAHQNLKIDCYNLRTGFTALMYAVMSHNTDAVDLIADKSTAKLKANLNFMNPLTGDTALMLAAQHGHIEAIEILHKFRADFSLSSAQTGFTALGYAILHKKLEAVKLILSFNPSELKVCPGETLLTLAEKSQNRDILSFVSKFLNHVGQSQIADKSFIEKNGKEAMDDLRQTPNSLPQKHHFFKEAASLVTKKENPSLQRSNSF